MINQQEKVIASKEEMLSSVQTAVTSTVSETVKAEIKTYSDVVKDVSSEQRQISAETLKSVVKSTMQEEDRSKNLMIFGLVEEENEELVGKVGNVFTHLGVKPVLETCRVGKHEKREHPRPVKVKVSCHSTAKNILILAKKLKDAEQFRSVFIRPDRSLEERLAHKILIDEVKRKRKDAPDKKHFIKDGKVMTEEKPNT